MMYEAFHIVESLALISFVVAFVGQPLAYGSPRGHHFPEGIMVFQEKDMPFWHDRGPFPELGGWQPLEVKEAGMHDELENALSKKGYDPSEIDERLNEIDGGMNKSPVFAPAPRYNPGMQMAGIPYPHPMSSVQNARWQTIRGDNNALGTGLAERERRHDNWSFTDGKGSQEFISKSIPTYPFWFHEPVRSWHSYSGQPSMPGLLFREPVWKHLIKDLKKRKSGDPTADPLFSVLSDQIITFPNDRNDGVLPEQFFREQVGALLGKQLGLRGPGTTNLHFASLGNDWASKHENSHHPERKSYKPLPLSQLETSIPKVSGDDIENGKPAQETLAQNNIGSPHTWMQILDVPFQFPLRFPQAHTNDVQEENASLSKHENSYYPERKTAKSFYPSILLPQLVTSILAHVSDAGIKNNKPVQETRAHIDGGNPNTWMPILDGPPEFIIRLPQTNNVQENAYLLQTPNTPKKLQKMEHETRSYASNEQKPQAQLTGLEIEISLDETDTEVPILSEDPEGISGYMLIPGTNEIKEPASDGDKNPNSKNESPSEDTDKHSKGPRNVTVHLEGKVEVTMEDDGKSYILSLPLHETWPGPESNSLLEGIQDP